jgi:long-subunit fatty acid transport protein
MNSSQSFTNSSTSLNNFGLAYVVPATRGSLVLGIGYGKQADYTSGLSFKGFNPLSSIIQVWAPDGQPYPPDLTRAEALELARVDTNAGTFISPIRDSLTQSGKLLEGGGMNYVSFSGAAEAARNLYLGVTLNFITGSYSYSRTYMEQDLADRYNAFPFDFSKLTVRDIIDADLSGFTAKFGLLYKFSPQGKLGLALKTPSWITVRETYSSDAQSVFDNGDVKNDPVDGDPGTGNEYDVTTPYVLSGGFSFGVENLTLAGDIEYTDWTQMEFRNANARLLSYNLDIKELYRPTVNLRFGAEFAIQNSDVRLRGGYAYLPSPYDGDPSDFAQKYITGGLGFLIENSVAVDLGYAYGTWDTFRQIYDGTFTKVENIKTHNLISTVSYRF